MGASVPAPAERAIGTDVVLDMDATTSAALGRPASLPA
jgi:hypothetical protein